MLIIDLNTESMYRAYMDCITDNLWSNVCCGQELHPEIQRITKHIEYLCLEQFDGISEMFSDGYTPLLMPSEMEWLETSKDVDIIVRIFDKDDFLIGTLTQEQLNW